jgi:predicted transposase YdaD
LSVEPIRADFVALLHPQERILHLEFQVEAVSDPPLPLRMLDYYVRLYRQYNRPVDRFVIFLKRTGSTAAYTDYLITDSITYRYRVVRLWEQDPAPLLANPALLPFATRFSNRFSKYFVRASCCSIRYDRVMEAKK